MGAVQKKKSVGKTKAAPEPNEPSCGYQKTLIIGCARYAGIKLGGRPAKRMGHTTDWKERTSFQKERGGLETNLRRENVRK